MRVGPFSLGFCLCGRRIRCTQSMGPDFSVREGGRIYIVWNKVYTCLPNLFSAVSLKTRLLACFAMKEVMAAARGCCPVGDGGRRGFAGERGL